MGGRLQGAAGPPTPPSDATSAIAARSGAWDGLGGSCAAAAPAATCSRRLAPGAHFTPCTPHTSLQSGAFGSSTQPQPQRRRGGAAVTRALFGKTKTKTEKQAGGKGVGTPGFKFDGAMQRWVRDDRFAGKSLTTVQPLRCDERREQAPSTAAAGQLPVPIKPVPLVAPSPAQRHGLHRLACHVDLPG